MEWRARCPLLSEGEVFPDLLLLLLRHQTGLCWPTAGYGGGGIPSVNPSLKGSRVLEDKGNMVDGEKKLIHASGAQFN